MYEDFRASVRHFAEEKVAPYERVEEFLGS